MRNLIRHILKEETDSVDPKKIGILKKFIIEYFSETDWFKDVDFEIGSWKSFISTYEIPEIKITIYISDDLVNEINFYNISDEIDFLMDMLFPKDYDGRPTAVWVMDVEPL